jgi:CBS domain containing-hemolysin-like protein
MTLAIDNVMPMGDDQSGFLIGLAALALLYLLLSLITGARLSLSSLTAERLAEESGLVDSFDPGSRPYEAVKLLRLSLLVLLTTFCTAGPATWCGPVAGIVIGLSFIVLGSLVQTMISPRHPAKLLRAAAPLLRVIDLLFGWMLAPLARTHERLSEAHRVASAAEDDQVKGEQMEEVIRDAEQEGLLEPEQGELVREIVDAGETTVREVMTPRVEIDAVNEHDALDNLLERFTHSRHSRLLVYEGTLDRVVGALALRDVMGHIKSSDRQFTARQLMRAVRHVPGSKYVLELLRELREERQQLAVVVDEYGNTAGLVTLEDLIEEIVGDIRDEHELPEDELRSDGRGGWIVDGLTSVGEVESRTGLELAADGVETIGGMVFSQLGRVPRVGERVTLRSGAVLEVTRMHGRRIATVRVQPAANH